MARGLFFALDILKGNQLLQFVSQMHQKILHVGDNGNNRERSAVAKFVDGKF